MVSSNLLTAAVLTSLYALAAGQAGTCIVDNALSFESIANDSASAALPDGFDDQIRRFEESQDALAGIGKRSVTRDLSKRADVVCTAQETCFSLLVTPESRVPLCVNVNNGAYHADGETGNLFTGDYTEASGSTGNFYSEAAALVASITASIDGQASVTEVLVATTTRLQSASVTSASGSGAVQSVSSAVGGVSSSISSARASVTSAAASSASTPAPTGAAKDLKAGFGGFFVAAFLGMLLG